jgi:hypothetical protein
MHHSYCLETGSYPVIGDATKLCAGCYRNWAETSEPAARTAP